MMVRTIPEDYRDKEVVLALSNAPTNDAAILEITRWARENGFVRSNEKWLSQRRASDGEVFFQSAIYRLDESVQSMNSQIVERIDQRREAMPMTPQVTLRENV